MRILTWNILHGGGPTRIPRLLMAMLDLKPDLIVVTEARRRFAGQLAAALADAGLAHALLPSTPDGVNGVLLVSRHPLRPVARPELPACLAHRWREAELPDLDLTLAGVHLAEAGRQPEHAQGWRATLRIARERQAQRFILAGDLNTWRDSAAGHKRSGAQATNLGRLAALGYTDAWQAVGPGDPGTTWSGGRGGAFRLDYVVVSAPLRTALRRAEVAHADRAERLSDHAAVVVELEEDPKKCL